MARKPTIADVLGFGGIPKRDLTQGFRREISKIKPGQKLQGSISRARPTAAQELARLLTPDTRFGAQLSEKIAPAVEMSPLGLLTGLVDARRQYQAGNTGASAATGLLAALGAIPGGKGASLFDTVRDAGMGQVFRRTPEGAYITVMENSKYAPRPNSVTDFVVPEEMRGKGIGGKMLDEIFSIYGPETISAAASSVPSVKAFYKRGLRPGGNPNATLDDAIKIMKEDSSVTMIKPKSEGIIAYHGSPHSFDRFDMSKIGTGEGAQAYGHGLYFAENEDVAKNYRDQLSSEYGFSFNGKQNLSRDEVISEVEKIYGRDFLDNVTRPSGIADLVIDSKILGGGGSRLKDGSQRKSVFDKLMGEISHSNPGSMYQVNINADPKDLLDWDKQFSTDGLEMFASKFDRVSPPIRNMLEDWAYQNSRRSLPLPDGQDIISKLGGVGNGNAKQVSRTLLEAGIPGIQYLDQGSRGVGSGTKNFVIFDDSLIDILKKYGIAFPALAGGGLLAIQPQDNGGL